MEPTASKPLSMLRKQDVFWGHTPAHTRPVAQSIVWIECRMLCCTAHLLGVRSGLARLAFEVGVAYASQGYAPYRPWPARALRQLIAVRICSMQIRRTFSSLPTP